MSYATRTNYLTRAGFLPSEARQLARTSRRGMQAPYFRAMINSRKGLLWNAKMKGWTNEQYRNAIKQQYIDRNCIKFDAIGRRVVDVWAILRKFEARTPIPDEYTSPWRKTAETKGNKRRALKRTTRQQHYRDWITQLKQRLEWANSPATKERLQKQIANLERALKEYE